MPRLKRNEYEQDDEKKDAYDIISEAVHGTTCAIPGCRPKFHLDEAREIVAKLKQYDLLKD